MRVPRVVMMLLLFFAYVGINVLLGRDKESAAGGAACGVVVWALLSRRSGSVEKTMLATTSLSASWIKPGDPFYQASSYGDAELRIATRVAGCVITHRAVRWYDRLGWWMSRVWHRRSKYPTPIRPVLP